MLTAAAVPVTPSFSYGLGLIHRVGHDTIPTTGEGLFSLWKSPTQEIVCPPKIEPRFLGCPVREGTIFPTNGIKEYTELRTSSIHS